MLEGKIGGKLVVLYAVTPLHVGMGRSGGAVDLPVQRDPLGYPTIFSSSFKGALKNYCGYVTDRIDKSGNLIDKKCLCLFGGEDGATSMVSVSDLTLFSIPLPSLDRGYVYASSHYLINRIEDLLGAIGKDEIKQVIKPKCTEIEVTIGTDHKAKLCNLDSNYFADMGSIAEKLKEGVVLLDDKYAVEIIEKGIYRVTRNRLSLTTKTVVEGSLWTEEYLPPGTIMVGILYYNYYRYNEHCEQLGEIDQVINDTLKTQFYMSVGGKESIGKGLVKVKLI